MLAFLARRDLPLFLVQASVAAGLGVTAVLGVLVLKWRLPPAEVALLVLLFVGITALVLSAEPHPSQPLGTAGLIALVVVLGAIAVRRLLRGPAARRARLGGARLAGRDRVLRRRGRRPPAGRVGVGRGVRHRPAALPADRPLAGRPAAARPGHAARLDHGGGRRDGRRRRGARRDRRPAAARRQDRPGREWLAAARLPGHAGRGDRPDPVRRAAAPPPPLVRPRLADPTVRRVNSKAKPSGAGQPRPGTGPRARPAYASTQRRSLATFLMI